MARVRVLPLLLLLIWATPASAQEFVRLQSTRVSDTLSSSGDTVVLTNALVGGFGSVKVQTLDSYTGTWEVQCSADGTTAGFDTGSELKLTPTDSTTVAYSVSDTVAIWDVGNAAACGAIRVIATAGFSGTDTVVVISATQSGGSGGGGGAGGGGSSDTTEATQLLVLAAVDGLEALATTSDASLAAIVTGIDNLTDALTGPGAAIDAVHGEDVIASGPQFIGEAKDIDGGALPNVVTEGKAIRAAFTLSGAAMTTLVNEAGTADIGASLLTAAQLIDDVVFADEAAFTYTTSKATAIAGVAESTTDAVADGVVATLITDTARRLVVTPTPSTYGGLSIYRSIDLDEGTGEVIKNGPGQLYSLWVTNTATSTRFIKIYNATSCTIGTGTPVITIGIPGNSSDDVAGQLTGGGMGIEFTTGICFGAVTGVADADTGAPGANDIVANAYYK